MKAHRYAGIVFRDHVGRVLLQFRDDWASKSPLCFAIFGGAALEGETGVQTALREIKEELGLELTSEDVRPLTELSWDSTRDDATIEVEIFEALKPLAWGEFVINEGCGAAFLSKAEVESLPFVSHLTKTVVGKHC